MTIDERSFLAKTNAFASLTDIDVELDSFLDTNVDSVDFE